MFGGNYDRKELESLLLDLDRIGILPEKEEIYYLLEKTKEEGNPYRKFLEMIRKEPERVLKEVTGHEIPVNVYTNHENEFCSIHGTEPLPTLEVNTKYKRLIKPRVPSYTFAVFPFLYLLYKNVGVDGRYISIDYNLLIKKKKLSQRPFKYKKTVSIPIFFSEKSTSERWKRIRAVHENIHAIRSMWHLSLNPWKEELHAFSPLTLYDPEGVNLAVISLEYGGMYGTLFGLNSPYLIFLSYISHFDSVVLFSGISLPLAASVVACWSYGVNYFRKIKRFIRKCLKEGINPYYLMLRTNVEEFNLEQPIRRQIEEKAKSKVRFKMIDVRLKKDPPPLP